MDIRRFFGVTPVAKKTSTDVSDKKKEKPKCSVAQKKSKDNKVKSPDDDVKAKHVNKKKRAIIDSDSEEEKKPVQSPKKPPDESPSPAQARKRLKPDPVIYVSESDEEDFARKKPLLKPKENGTSLNAHAPKQVVPSKAKTPPKPAPQEKRTKTSVEDYFGGMGNIKRSDKKLVATKRKELERQIHEDEDFARTLAMVDEAPRNKVQKKHEEKQKSPQFKISPTNREKPAVQTSVRPVSGSERTCIKEKKIEHATSADEKTSSLKTSPVKASTKLALMKQKDDGVKKDKELPKPETIEKTISPKEEETTPVKSSLKSESSPEDSEKKKSNYRAYRNFLNREGPKALGSKEIPVGADNCMEGMTFVITGVLESLERDEAKSLIERYGGKVTGNVSKKTNYLVLGRDGGESKREKAESLGTKVLDEDGLLTLIRTLPGKRSKYVIKAEAEAKKIKAENTDECAKRPSPNKKKSGPAEKISPSKRKSTPEKKATPIKESKDKQKDVPVTEERMSPAKSLDLSSNARKCESLLWVDKYKPSSIKAIIGQQGDQSGANKLLKWLKTWHHNHSSEEKKSAATFSKFGGRDDGSSSKAALLSGPPGIGKTTTAVLVCEELGYSYVELNASDTRSKNSMKQVVAESLNNTSIKGFYSGTSKSVSTKHALIMDEVDGMAGNEDRGGVQELIGLIKHSKIPIICMCNDRNHPKIRSLANYCYDLRFQRPRVEQIKGAMMTVAFKEGLKIPPPAMNEIILGANQDIRQVLHNLSMWSASNKSLTYDEAKSNANSARKDIKMGPFDVVRKVFGCGEETAHMTLIDKSDLFFHDYSLAPLFVQENYIHMKPTAASGNNKRHLLLLSKTADSICDGDLVDRVIRSRQIWSLLPTQAIYASVLPGELMKGYMSQFPNFPSWLGKFSSTGKHDRITQELAMHMCLRTHSSKRALNLDYMPYLRNMLVRPLTAQGADGVQEVVDMMDSYYLMKEDFDNIMDICSWGGKPSAFSKLDPKVKAAFTRGYNKVSHLTPYSLQTVKASKRETPSSLESELGEDVNPESQVEEKEDEMDLDAMIKAKKTKSSKSEKVSKPRKGGEKKQGKSKGKTAK
uniref:Replication factor C subunit 1 n=1 Tax=Leptobrachium leishanense TaxID=445787 RepID=A0A8C5LQE5_9ANUR